MIRKNALITFCTVMLFLVLSTAAHAVTLTFSTLAGPTDTPYIGHTELGFDVSVTGGNWFEAHVFGNPTPDIYAGPIGSVGVSEISVSRSTPGIFNFSSVDLASNNGLSSSYDFTGSLGGIIQYSTLGSIASGPPYAFSTFLSGAPTLDIDMLTIMLTPGSGTTSLNLDNIVVAAVDVPEPSTLLLLGSGLVGLGFVRRKLKA